jgi:hypothetical protein
MYTLEGVHTCRVRQHWSHQKHTVGRASHIAANAHVCYCQRFSSLARKLLKHLHHILLQALDCKPALLGHTPDSSAVQQLLLLQVLLVVATRTLMADVTVVRKASEGGCSMLRSAKQALPPQGRRRCQCLTGTILGIHQRPCFCSVAGNECVNDM